jgi:pimeloyl-ACP methyl ester carboxylesterase
MGLSRTAVLHRLADGRTLGCAEWGDPDGRAVIEMHGNPGGRLLLWDEDVLRASGVRWITVDRPGIGVSDALPGRGLTGWPRDVAELADTLGAGRFAVVGFSVGGAYAAACARELPGRVSAAALVSSIAPFDRPGSFEALGPQRVLAAVAAGPAPLGARPAVTGHGRARRSRPRRQGARRRAVERRRRARPPAARGGCAGDRPGERRDPARRRRTRRGPSDRDEAVGVPARGDEVPTAVWQGDDGGSIPAAWAERLAAQIPGARLHVRRGEGHLLMADRLGEIVSWLPS